MTQGGVSSPLGLRLRSQVDGGLHADIVKMLVEETPCRSLTGDLEHFEKIVISRKLTESVEMGAETVEHDAMNVDAPVLSRSDAARKLALIDQPGDEVDGAIFADKRGVEGDFVDPVHDFAGRHWRRLPHQRIDLHHQNILGGGGAEKWKDDRITEITAIPIGHAVDFHGAENRRQTCGRHDRFSRDLVARKDAYAAGLDVGRRDEELEIGAGAQLLEIDEALDQILERIDIERIDVIGREVARYGVEPNLHGSAFQRRKR